MGIVRVCAAAAAAAVVILYSWISFPHRGRCLTSLLMLLCTCYAVGGGVVAVPAASRPLALNPRQKRFNFRNVILYALLRLLLFAFVLRLPLLLPLLFTACVRFRNSVYRRCCCCWCLCCWCCCRCCCSRTPEHDLVAPPIIAAAAAAPPFPPAVPPRTYRPWS